MSDVQAVSGVQLDAMTNDGGLPVLVDFWATWCGPCRAMEPVVDQIANAYEGKVRVVKVDVDAHPDPASQYAVTGVPTLLLLRAGQPVWSMVGAKPHAVVSRDLDAHL